MSASQDRATKIQAAAISISHAFPLFFPICSNESKYGYPGTVARRILRTLQALSRPARVRLATGCLALLGLDSVESLAAEQTRPLRIHHAAASAEPAAVSTEQVERLLRRMEEQNAKLVEQNAKLAEQNARLAEQNQSLARRVAANERNQTAPLGQKPVALGAQPPTSLPPVRLSTQPAPPSTPALQPAPRLQDDEDQRGQIVVAQRQTGRMPFELRADLFSQVRYTNFDRQADIWSDSVDRLLPVRSFNSMELTRNFIQLSGYALDPQLQFTANIFSSTATNTTVYLGWINYQFSKALDLRVGNWIVPGTREWNESFRYTLGADRLMATTFFRPNISPGIWAQGEPLDNVHYIAMVANSLNRFNQGADRIGSSMAFGGTLWWEPMGPFGPGPSDIEDHQRLNTRIGTNVAFSHESNQGLGSVGTSNPEDTILRLSDGTPLFRPGVLAPGVELISTNVNLWTLDSALKYRGFSLSGEYFLRWLDNFDYVGGDLPIASLFDHGALLQGGYFVMPSLLEGFARSSFVSGRFGDGYEIGGGINWYLRKSRDYRVTFEVLNINRSPAQNLLTGYRAGESGTLYQLQLFTDFF